MPSFSLRVATTFTVCLFTSPVATAEPARWTISLRLNNQPVEGTPLGAEADRVYLLSRDGRLLDFNASAAKDSRKASSTFRGYSAAEMRERLSKELGRSFEVTHTGHYLVAHPKGTKKDWAPRFEEMYRQFVHYFTIRGFAPKEPEFPLVAIVFSSEAEFQRYAAADGTPLGPGYLGYYSPRTNRVALFDQGSSESTANADTVIHEVTHQTAYNTGIHRRFASTPRWLAEGLGTMFEARGVWNSRSYPRRDDRLNRGRLSDFQQMAKSFKKGFIAEMIASDRLFDQNAPAAYCQAWAFSFYLAEKMPKKYCDYLALTARRPTFQDYTAAERMKDFTSVFGTELALTEAQFLKFVQELK